jgi:hypothetical protein
MIKNNGPRRWQRTLLFVLVKVLRTPPDTLVYVCRDIGLDRSSTTYLLSWLYKIRHGEAKQFSFLSPAWGQKAVKENLELHEQLFEWLKAEAKQVKQEK